MEQKVTDWHARNTVDKPRPAHGRLHENGKMPFAQGIPIPQETLILASDSPLAAQSAGSAPQELMSACELLRLACVGELEYHSKHRRWRRLSRMPNTPTKEKATKR